MLSHAQPVLVFAGQQLHQRGRQLSCFKTSGWATFSPPHWLLEDWLKFGVVLSLSGLLTEWFLNLNVALSPRDSTKFQQVLDKEAPCNGKWLLTCSAKQPHWYAGDFSPCDFQRLPQHQTDISKRLRTEGNIWYPFKAKTSDLMKTVSEWDMIQISNYICLVQHSLINHSNI